ncbi:MAG: cobalamin-binding protein, partial [Proteobacteria bacterium]|nr:cobalamin-binding protein [Pseudomonadota bacterium]
MLCATSAFAGVSVRDDYGHEVRLARPAARVVSLSPHLTELLFAAGAGSRTVGALEHSDYPAAARALPRVGSEAGIDLEAVIALRPDLVVAWPQSGSRGTLERLATLGLPLYRSEPRELDDIASTLERLGTLTGSEDGARRAALAFRARTAALRERYAGRAPVRVFYQVWNRPLITVTGAHVISKALALCGGENVFAALPGIAPEIDREAVLAADPEVIVASGIDAIRPAWLDDWREFASLTAVARGNLHALPAALIQRHTPRLLEGAERLCLLLETARARRVQTGVRDAEPRAMRNREGRPR